MAAEVLERRLLLDAVVAPPDAVMGPVAAPLPPRPGHSFYVEGSANTWDQNSAITPNTVNDLILNAAPIDSNYVPCCEAITAPGGVTDPAQPNTIKLLTNGTTQSLVSPGGALDQGGAPDGKVSDPSDPTNIIADVNTPWHATYSLGHNPNGYDISEIDSITGHQDYRTQQHIEIEVEPIGSSQFFILSNGQGFSFMQTGDTPPVTLGKGSAQMAIVSDTPRKPIASNIQALRFDNLMGDQAFFRELVVTGTLSAAPPTHPAAAPTQLVAAVPPSVGGVQLTWTDNADNETGYLIQRSTSLAGPFATLAAVAAVEGTGGTGTFIDQNLAVPGSYYYQVVALGPGGASASSNIAGPVAITQFYGAEANYYGEGFWSGPVALSRPVHSSIDFTWSSGSADPSIRNFADSVAFTGKVTTDDAGVYTFVSNTDDDGYLYVNGVLVSSDPGDHGPQDATRLTPISLAAHTAYDYVFLENNNQDGAAAHLQWITPAMAASGPGAHPTIVPVSHLTFPADTPNAPANLVLDGGVAPNPSSSRVAFTFSSDNIAIVHYLLERSGDGGQTWAAVNQIDPASATQNSAGTFVPATVRIEDSSPLPGLTYQYRVRGVDYDGTSPASNVISVAIPMSPQSPGVEGRFYNGEIASAGDGQDPRDFALAGINPTEFVADTSGITAGSGGPIDSDFGNGSPDPSPYPDVPRIHPQSYATVWTGKIVTDQAGLYTFISNTDDDGYMYVNDALVSADPGDHGQRGPTAVVPLTLAAHTAYNFVILHQQRSGPSAVHVYWIEPGQTAPTPIPTYVPPLLGLPAKGGLEQVMDTPHRQAISRATGSYTIDDPSASAAGNLLISAVSSAGVTLNWSDQSPSELWFEVQRTSDGATSPTAVWSTVGRAGFDTGGFTDLTATDASPTKVYSYRVRAVNFDAAGPWSNIAVSNNVTLPTPTITAQACQAGTVRLVIVGQSPNSGGFQILYSPNGAQWINAPGTPAPNTSTSFDVTGLDPGKVYQFRVRNLAGPQAPSPSPFSNIATASGDGPPLLDFSGGFLNAVGLQLNGSARVVASGAAAPNALQLTQPALSENASAFSTAAQNITAFDTRFQFVMSQFSNPAGDGLTFVIQNSPVNLKALGPAGGGLGYGPDSPFAPPGIPNSVAIKFDLYSNAGEGSDSTGLFVDGHSPSVPGPNADPAEISVDMSGSGVNLHAAGDVFDVHLSYDGATLHETVTDLAIHAVFGHDYKVNIPMIVGGPCAYVGFTGATGGGWVEQDILRWSFVSTPQTVSGTGGNDTIVLRKDPDGTDVDWSRDGGLAVPVPLTGPLTINGFGGAETIVLDNSNGNPLPKLLKLNGNFTLKGLTGLAFGQTVDLASGTLRIAYSGASPLSAIQGYLRSGYNGGKWNGTGIISSTAASTPGLGVADVDSGSAVTLNLRRFGDANGDGVVDFKDLVILAQGYGKSGAGIDWSKGDFSYDGTVDFADLVLLAQSYGRPASPMLVSPKWVPTLHRRLQVPGISVGLWT